MMTEPAEHPALPGLRRIAYMLIFAVVLIITSQVILNFFQAAHTDEVVETVNTFLSRGDCRSANQTDVFEHLAEMLDEATKPTGRDPARVREEVRLLKIAADHYAACSPDKENP
jgi:hypothetical protein